MLRPLDLVLVWHMHQPDYRDQASGEFAMPWVYLHALKDYTDMAWHLERHPGMRAVINFVPVLLDQLEDYCDQFDRGTLRDPLLRLLARSAEPPLSDAERALALDRCFHGNHGRLIAPFPSYKRLHDLYLMLEPQGEEAFRYLSDEYFRDLVTWYHLSWTGESMRRESEVVARMMAVGGKFSHADRSALYDTIADAIRKIIPRYRRLAEAGRIELSTTPHTHPLAPLLLDFKSALDAVPDMKLPESPCYSGGRARVSAQIEMALASHAQRFGVAARGVWPAEGAVSSAFLALLDAHGVAWAASGEAVLANSMQRGGKPLPPRADYLYRPYVVTEAGEQLACFFRDDRLSDLIGFEYSKWHGRDAAANFVGELEAIAETAAQRAAGAAELDRHPVVTVILDGENPWEFYPYNGYYFLSDLYESLEKHPAIRARTFANVLDDMARRPAGAAPATGRLSMLCAGSWVYGSFTTWIGSHDKNRAWDLLCAAKECFDHVITSGRLNEAQQAAALRQLADCESSDWFWWPGDYNASETVAAFERLFRAKLTNLYRTLSMPAPANLLAPFSLGAASAAGGAMRRTAQT